MVERPKKSDEKISNVESCRQYRQQNLEHCQKMESVRKKDVKTQRIK